nr:telomere repeat-binding factor 1-like [Ipomoea batatas]
MALTNVVQSEEESSEGKRVATSSGSPQNGGSKRSIIRLDNLVMDAINNLKEPGGSNKKTIAAYIEVSLFLIEHTLRRMNKHTLRRMNNGISQLGLV